MRNLLRPAGLALAGLAASAAVSAQPPLYVLTTGNQLARTSEGAPAAAAANLSTVTGLAAGDALVGIDLRPLNGRLYGLGFNAGAGTVTLYHLTFGLPNTLAFAVGAPVAFSVPVAGPDFGFDFNPTVDRIRVVTSAGQNFRLNPNTGAGVDSDANGGNGLTMDGAITGATSLVGTAYTNDTVYATVTTQYTLSSASDALYVQNPPNNGVQTLPLPLTLNGNALDFSNEAGFDIAYGVGNTAVASNTPVTGTALASLTVGGVTSLYRIELGSGATSLVGDFGGLAVRDIALGPAQGTAHALDATGASLLRFAMLSPGTTVTTAVTGVAAGETLVGIDSRPATGQLMGLGVNPASDTGTLYLIDPQTGAASAIGAAGQVAFVLADGATPVDLPNASWGFDFNPTVDRVRVVNSLGLNFRLNPLTGGPVDSDTNAPGVQTDPGINGMTGGALSGAAYSNNEYGTAITTLYTLDSTGNRLFIQNPANGGTQTAARSVTQGGFALDFGPRTGFDIPPGVNAPANSQEAPGLGYATLSLGGGALLYGIDLPTGSVQELLGPIGANTTLDGFVAWNAPIYGILRDGFE